MPTITRLAEKVVTCERDFANLDAAGGIYLARDWKGPEPEPEGRIFLYGAYHWRVSRCVRFIEFCGDHPASAPVITDIEDGWVDLYEHPDFRGQRLTIAGTADAEIPDYGAIQVQDCGFSDRVSSVRYQLPAGTTYRLYRDDKFHPQRGSVGLVGDGLVHEIRDLNAELGFDNAASSSKYD
jgi:hypothetical protein